MVQLKIEHGVAWLSLNNPSKHNAFDDQLIKQLSDSFNQLANDDQVRCMVLSARGKHFSAGGDLNWMQRMVNYSEEENQQDALALAHMLKSLNELPFPTIARVQGAAYGGAVGLVSCCDIAVGSEMASFCLSEVKVGLIPATIAPYVVAAIGQRAARRYCLSAEVINAQTAVQLGLLSVVCKAEHLDSEVKRFIDLLLKNSPTAMRECKTLLQDIHYQTVSDTVLNETSKRIAKLRVSEQGQEGLNAFLEKRPPNWQTKGSD